MENEKKPSGLKNPVRSLKEQLTSKIKPGNKYLLHQKTKERKGLSMTKTTTKEWPLNINVVTTFNHS